MSSLRSVHLERLESEAIIILREAAAAFPRLVLLYSIGKDSSVLLHLARKAFYPAKIPFPLLHIDTTWKFREMIAFRDRTVTDLGLHLIVHTNEDGRSRGINPIATPAGIYTRIMKTEALKQALNLHRFNAAIGGARRDEEVSRAKERIFSVRGPEHAWDPRRQRPELWQIYNTKLAPEETMRIFPLSNWTELDVWRYLLAEDIPIVPLYFSAKRPVVRRNGALVVIDDDRLVPNPDEKVEMLAVRFRSLGCYPLTAAVPSEARTLEDIVAELSASRRSEREGRMIDNDDTSTMEHKKREGYF